MRASVPGRPLPLVRAGFAQKAAGSKAPRCHTWWTGSEDCWLCRGWVWGGGRTAAVSGCYWALGTVSRSEMVRGWC